MHVGDMDREELRKNVALMRELGVAQWGDIALAHVYDPRFPLTEPDTGKQLDPVEKVKADRRAFYENALNTVVNDELLEKLP